jgi:hypothetical protein
MTAFQSLNTAVFAGTLAALVNATAKIGTPIWQLPASFSLWLGFKLGFLIGVVSWFLWALGAAAVGTVRDAYLLVAAAIAVSTIWILVAPKDASGASAADGGKDEKKFWVATNILYALGLVVLYVVDDPSAPLTVLLLVLALIVVGVDYVRSRSILEPQPAQ